MIYELLHHISDTVLKSTDTRFIGAWWLDFVIMLFLRYIMFCYPRKLDSKKECKNCRRAYIVRGKSLQTTSFNVERCKGKYGTRAEIVEKRLFTKISYCIKHESAF